MSNADASTSLSALTALSPLDGRYRDKVAALAAYFSEYGLIRHRIHVEIVWLQALADEASLRELTPFSKPTRTVLADAVAGFSGADAERVKAIERTTNHDVKAIEYWMKERFATTPEIARAAEFIHFACTSEDINNLAYGLMLAEARAVVLLPALREHVMPFLADTLHLGGLPFDDDAPSHIGAGVDAVGFQRHRFLPYRRVDAGVRDATRRGSGARRRVSRQHEAPLLDGGRRGEKRPGSQKE